MPLSSPLSSLQYALHVYNEVMNVGQKYGIRNAGYYALRSLRIEKFFAFWGQDLNTLTTPLECGRESRVKLEKVLCSPSCIPAKMWLWDGREGDGRAVALKGSV